MSHLKSYQVHWFIYKCLHFITLKLPVHPYGSSKKHIFLLFILARNSVCTGSTKNTSDGCKCLRSRSAPHSVLRRKGKATNTSYAQGLSTGRKSTAEPLQKKHLNTCKPAQGSESKLQEPHRNKEAEETAT